MDPRRGVMRLVGWARALAWRLRGGAVARVRGGSMAPAVSPGDVLLLASPRRFGPGDVVIARHPYRRGVRILKRVVRSGDDGWVDLAGDASSVSTDSRAFGAVRASDVVAVVVSNLGAL